MAHTRNFISNVDDTRVVDSRVVSQAGHREPLKHLLIGSKKAVISTIHYLHVLGYANATDISILMRQTVIN